MDEIVSGNFDGLKELMDLCKSIHATVEFLNMDKEFRDGFIEVLDDDGFVPDYVLTDNLEILDYGTLNRKDPVSEVWLWDDCHTVSVAPEAAGVAGTMFEFTWLAKATRSESGWTVKINKKRHRERM